MEYDYDYDDNQKPDSTEIEILLWWKLGTGNDRNWNIISMETIETSKDGNWNIIIIGTRNQKRQKLAYNYSGNQELKTMRTGIRIWWELGTRINESLNMKYYDGNYALETISDGI